MRTLNFHRPHFHRPHFHMPHFGRHAAASTAEHHHHHPAFQTLKRVEGGIDLLAIALVVLIAIAMVYGLLTATGHPSYFDRWPS